MENSSKRRKTDKGEDWAGSRDAHHKALGGRAAPDDAGHSAAVLTGKECAYHALAALKPSIQVKVGDFISGYYSKSAKYEWKRLGNEFISVWQEQVPLRAKGNVSQQEVRYAFGMAHAKDLAGLQQNKTFADMLKPMLQTYKDDLAGFLRRYGGQVQVSTKRPREEDDGKEEGGSSREAGTSSGHAATDKSERPEHTLTSAAQPHVDLGFNDEEEPLRPPRPHMPWTVAGDPLDTLSLPYAAMLGMGYDPKSARAWRRLVCLLKDAPRTVWLDVFGQASKVRTYEARKVGGLATYTLGHSDPRYIKALELLLSLPLEAYLRFLQGAASIVCPAAPPVICPPGHVWSLSEGSLQLLEDPAPGASQRAHARLLASLNVQEHSAWTRLQLRMMDAPCSAWVELFLPGCLFVQRLYLFGNEASWSPVMFATAVSEIGNASPELRLKLWLLVTSSVLAAVVPHQQLHAVALAPPIAPIPIPPGQAYVAALESVVLPPRWGGVAPSPPITPAQQLVPKSPFLGAPVVKKPPGKSYRPATRGRKSQVVIPNKRNFWAATGAPAGYVDRTGRVQVELHSIWRRQQLIKRGNRFSASSQARQGILPKPAALFADTRLGLHGVSRFQPHQIAEQRVNHLHLQYQRHAEANQAQIIKQDDSVAAVWRAAAKDRRRARIEERRAERGCQVTATPTPAREPSPPRFPVLPAISFRTMTVPQINQLRLRHTAVADAEREAAESEKRRATHPYTSAAATPLKDHGQELYEQMRHAAPHNFRGSMAVYKVLRSSA